MYTDTPNIIVLHRFRTATFTRVASKYYFTTIFCAQNVHMLTYIIYYVQETVNRPQNNLGLPEVPEL